MTKPQELGQAPLRVLIACDHIGYGANLHGSGRFLVELLQVLRARGIDARACVLRDPGGLVRQMGEAASSIDVLGNARFSPAPAVTLARRARAMSADVLHVWDFGAATWGRLAGLLARRPVVVHVHSHHSAHQRRGFPVYVRVAYRLLAPLAARTVVISASVRAFAQHGMGFDERQLVTVGNPVPQQVARPVAPGAVDALRRAYGFESDEPVIGAVTRLYPVKGIDVLLDAFAIVVRRVPRARLLIVGDGPLRAALEARARTLGVAPRTFFAGHRADVATHYRLFAVTAMPSREEGMPMAAIESIAAGTPLVASREGGLSEVVADGRSGLMVPVDDAPALADALVRLLSDDGLAAHLRAGCTLEATRFSADVFADAMTAVYRSAVMHGAALVRRSNAGGGERAVSAARPPR